MMECLPEYTNGHTADYLLSSEKSSPTHQLKMEALCSDPVVRLERLNTDIDSLYQSTPSANIKDEPMDILDTDINQSTGFTDYFVV